MDVKLLDYPYDPDIIDGDFAIETEADPRHKEHLLLGGLGCLRHAPTVGAGVPIFHHAPVDSTTQAKIRTRVSRTLSADGFRVESVTVSSEPMEDGDHRILIDEKSTRQTPAT